MGQAEDSTTLQAFQLTELKQTKEWERYPNRFRRLCETLLPENLENISLSRTASRQNGVSKPRSGKCIQTDSGVSMRHSCQKTWEINHCREWPSGKMESEIKFFIQENSKPQGIVYTDGCHQKANQGGASLSNKVRPPSMKTVQPIRSQPAA